jgi:hypothetical protein
MNKFPRMAWLVATLSEPVKQAFIDVSMEGSSAMAKSRRSPRCVTASTTTVMDALKRDY